MSDSGTARLGRGLAALMGDAPPGAAPRRLPVAFLHPGAFQPRQHFDPAEQAALTDSVRQTGLLQPILVRPLPPAAQLPEQTPSAGAERAYEIIAGERRWRAAQAAGLHEVPVIVGQWSDQEALQVALVENLQRTDLNPLEEAAAYRRLLHTFGQTQQTLAQAVGKSRSHVANTLRLLELPGAVRQWLAEAKLSAGHGRALLAASDPVALARRVMAEDLSVRTTETLARRTRTSRAKTPKNADLRDLEARISARLGLGVTITPRRAGGTVRMICNSAEQLDALCRRLLDPAGP